MKRKTKKNCETHKKEGKSHNGKKCCYIFCYVVNENIFFLNIVLRRRMTITMTIFCCLSDDEMINSMMLFFIQWVHILVDILFISFTFFQHKHYYLCKVFQLFEIKRGGCYGRLREKYRKKVFHLILFQETNTTLSQEQLKSALNFNETSLFLCVLWGKV